MFDRPSIRTFHAAYATIVASVFVLLAMGPRAVGAQAGAPEQAMDPVDYSDEAAWLCLPGREDACAIDLRTTVVEADGSTIIEQWMGNPTPSVDCFYVYPTVSTDQGTYSDMMPNEAEVRVVAQQFARFGSVCRTFAPSYRQVTLAGLRTRLAGGGASGLDAGPQYEDVVDAFHHYIENENDGRGFVLVGHSQGTYILTRLIREEVEGSALENRMVSAFLMGSTVTVAPGRDTGGSFRHLPLCHSALEVGCIVTFASFRATAPPPENTLFGAAPEGQETACTNPAALEGGSGQLRAYLSAAGTTIVGGRPAPPWIEGGPEIETPFVAVPGLLSAECASNEYAKYLAITIHADASDPRVDNIVGDLTPQWGLHLVDANLTMGNLIGIVRQQAIVWASR